jgi:hypothetical protein
MVQFCPKCGTKAPDDESAFCNKCGTRLPPVIQEKKDNICPRCGAKAPDEQSAFCNKCGSPLHTIPPVQVQPTGAPPGAARPVMKKECCPSCGAPLVDEISAYCNVCGANIRRPAPLTPARETSRLSREKTGPGTLVADRADDGKDVPLQEKSRRPFLKWGVMAIVAVILLVVIAAFIPGIMTPGTNQSSTTTPIPATHTQISKTTVPTQKTTQITVPVIVPTTPVPTTVVSTKTTTKITTTVTATRTTSASANVSANANVTTTPVPTISSQPYSIGQSATDGKAKVTVNSITFKDKLSDPLPSYAVGKKYLIVNITYENLQQNTTADVNLNAMAVTDAGGYAFEKVSDVLLENPFMGNTILPQQNRTGNMLFIVPPEATFLKFQYDFGNQIIAKFQLT